MKHLMLTADLKKYISQDSEKILNISFLSDSVNLNEIDFLSQEYDSIAIDGLLEGVLDADNFFEKIGARCLKEFVFSYNVFESPESIEERRENGWINDFSFNQLVWKLQKMGFALTFFKKNRANSPNQYIFKFEKKSVAALVNQAFCAGCGACAAICPANALKMELDESGFFKPKRFDSCIQCGKCVAICPSLNFVENKDEVGKEFPKTYACMADDAIRFDSSSGGAFFLLAEHILLNGGIVFGAAWKNDFSVSHIFIESVEQLHLLQKSKYVQSDTQNTFLLAKDFLRQNRKILYVGTPCQIAGLKRFLGSDAASELLVTVDLLCNHVPSRNIFQKYLAENYGNGNITGFTFRDKAKGETSDLLKIQKVTGEVIYKNITNDCFSQGFEHHLFFNDTCEHCFYRTEKREGDITLGDFWGIEWFDKSLRDGKGASAVLVNSLKGNALFEAVRSKFAKCSKAPLSIIKTTQFKAERKRHKNSALFEKALKTKTFNQSVSFALNPRFDVLLLAIYSNRNFGGTLTYYALYTILNKLGYSCLLADRPFESPWKPTKNIGVFRENPYPEYLLIPQTNYREEMRKYVEICDTVMVGSDQFYYFPLYHSCSDIFSLDFVDSSKRKVAYAASWARNTIEGSEKEKQDLAFYLSRFDAVSVREKNGVRLVKETFDIDSDFVLDPVFLCGDDEYKKLAYKSEKKVDEPYIFSYIVDPNEEKASFLKEISNKLKMKTVAVAGAEYTYEKVSDMWTFPTERDVSLEDWLKLLKEADYVVTDSFHGVSLCILFQKQFLAVNNEYRGDARFESILESLDLRERLIKNLDDENGLLDKLSAPIDYKKVSELLETLRRKSKDWLCNALSIKKKKNLSDFDICKEKIDSTILFQKKYESIIQASAQRITGLEQYAKSNDELVMLLRQQLNEFSQRITGLETQRSIFKTCKFFFLNIFGKHNGKD